MSNIGGVIKSIQNIMWQDTGLNGDAQRIEQLGWMLFLKIFSDKDKELELLDENYTSPIPDQFHWIMELIFRCSCATCFGDVVPQKKG